MCSRVMEKNKQKWSQICRSDHSFWLIIAILNALNTLKNDKNGSFFEIHHFFRKQNRFLEKTFFLGFFFFWVFFFVNFLDFPGPPTPAALPFVLARARVFRGGSGHRLGERD